MLGLAVVLAATLNTVGGARYATSRLDAYVGELEQRFPAKVALVLHRVFDPALRAYSSASVSVVVGGSLVAYVLNLPSLDLPRSCGDIICYVGCALIVTLPVFVERRAHRHIARHAASA